MEVVSGDLFNQECNAICIPTNGALDKMEHCVMGAGVAKQAASQWPYLPKLIGDRIAHHGSHVWCITAHDHGPRMLGPQGQVARYHLVNFPTKPGKIFIEEEGWDAVLPRYRKPGSGIKIVPGWMGYASLNIIRHSAIELAELTGEWGWKRVCLPKIGIGYGGLSWQAVRETIRPILDDRFVVVEYRPGVSECPIQEIPQDKWELMLKQAAGERDD